MKKHFALDPYTLGYMLPLFLIAVRLSGERGGGIPYLPKNQSGFNGKSINTRSFLYHTPMNSKIFDWQSIQSLNEKETENAFLERAKSDTRSMPVLGMLRVKSRLFAKDDDSPLARAKAQAEKGGYSFHAIDNARNHEKCFALVMKQKLPMDKYMELTYRDATALAGAITGMESREAALAYMAKTKFRKGWVEAAAKRGEDATPKKESGDKKPNDEKPKAETSPTPAHTGTTPPPPDNVVQFAKPKTAIEAFGEIQSLAKMLDDKQLEALRTMLARWSNEPAKFVEFKKVA